MLGLRQRAVWKSTLLSVVFFQFVLAIAMMASPWLHERLHQNAYHHDHECAVTVMLSGASDGSAPVPAIVIAPSSPTAATIESETRSDVASLFLIAHIFEHAPPVVA
jgi:hypothetical protein